MTSENSNINSSIINEEYVINILDDNYNEKKIDNDSESEILSKNTKLNTLMNTHLNLSDEEYRKLQKFYSINNDIIVYKQKKIIKPETYVKLLVIVTVILMGSPFIIGDLYYGYNDNSCVNDYPDGLNVNMKTYLLVNGYYSIIIVSYVIISILCISITNIYSITNDENSLYLILLHLLKIVLLLFITIWNIIGAVIFWGKLYTDHNCDNYISKYLFISLIFKLLCNWISLQKLKYNLDNE
jgi:hypothetical protein